MAFQSVSACAQLVLNYGDASWAFDAGVNCLQFQKTSGMAFNATDCDNLLNAATTAWDINLAPVISSQVGLNSASVRDLQEETPYVADTSWQVPGEVASAGLPYNVTIAISKRTGVAGRTRRGRIYHIGLCENQVTGNTLLATPAVDILTAWRNYFSDIESAGFVHVLVSRWLNGVKRTVGLKFPITEYQFTDTRVDTMRRRLNSGN